MQQKVKSFTDLHVWKLAHALRLDVYKIIKLLPVEEKYNLASQIRRSVCSVAANIAEGYGRYHFQENIQFCRQARGSLDETKDHLIFIFDVHMIVDRKEHEQVQILIGTCDITKYVLNTYISALLKQKNISDS